MPKFAVPVELKDNSRFQLVMNFQTIDKCSTIFYTLSSPCREQTPFFIVDFHYCGVDENDHHDEPCMILQKITMSLKYSAGNNNELRIIPYGAHNLNKTLTS